jgi:3-deoxy-D-manno-octulosonic acid (KDO) 8-phosphate synthase
MKDKICLLIDVAIPSDRNVIQKESEKKLKYKNLSIEIKRMWNMKCFIIPVIIGATGIVNQRTKKKSGNNTRREFNRFSTNNSCTRNITHYKESATV